MYILGINSVYHESSACLLKDGKIVAAVEEAKFNRAKKETSIISPDRLPLKAIDYCLKKAHIKMENVDYIGYSFDPNFHYKKNKSVSKFGIKDILGSEAKEKEFFIFNKQVVSLLEKHYNTDLTSKFKFIPHHVSHIASAFFVSPYSQSAILCVDGVGQFESTTMALGSGNKIKMVDTIDYPDSLGFLWGYFAKYLGFEGHETCKIISLAPYGNPHEYLEEFNQIISYDENGHFKINKEMINVDTDDFSALEQLLGKARKKDGMLLERYENIAASLQYMTEEIIVRLSNYLQAKTGLNNLCIAGDIGLNCMVNSKLINKTKFDNICVQPVTSDAGTSVGAAYYIYNHHLNQEDRHVLEHAYLGPEYSNDEIKEILDSNHLHYMKTPEIEKTTAKLLASGKIVGWFQGNMEFGPRALGNRSLLVDPRADDMKDRLHNRLNIKVPFLPYSLSIKDESSDKYIDGKRSPGHKYMLSSANVISENIPAAVHVNGMAMIQEVDRNTNPRYHKLLSEFEELTGVGALLNTSFSDLEPNVCTPEDAISEFLNSDIDFLIMGDFILSKKLNENKKAISA